MRKSIAMFLICISAASGQKKLDQLGDNYFVNNDAEFYFNKNGSFTYYDLSIYRSDVYVVFCNEWTKGSWKQTGEFIELNSALLINPVQLNVTKTQKNISDKNTTITLKDSIFKKDYRILLINNINQDTIDVDLDRPLLKLDEGEYFISVLPNKELIQKRMIINVESLKSNVFIISSNTNYDIEIDFDKNIFAYRTFNNIKIKLKRNKIVFEKWSFMKMLKGYTSKISSYY